MYCDETMRNRYMYTFDVLYANENKQNSVSLKKNTDGHQKTRYENNIKCSDNTHLPPKEITKQSQHH